MTECEDVSRRHQDVFQIWYGSATTVSRQYQEKMLPLLRLTTVELRLTTVELRLTTVELQLATVELQLTTIELQLTTVELRLSYN